MAAGSPSPSLSRPSVHNPRTPDDSHGLRKSKEIPQRSSLSKPNSFSTRSSFEQKENAKSRSPVVSKGSKNFMAPTISAVSKAVPPSPRKKILHERNEVMNLVSDSFELPLTGVGNCAEIENIGLKSEMGFGSREALSCGQVKKGESRIKNPRNVVVPPIPPLSVVSSLDAGNCAEIEDIGLKSEMGFGSREALSYGEVKKGESRIKNPRNVVVPPISPLSVVSPLDAGNCAEIEDIGLKSDMGFGSREALSYGEVKKGESRIKNPQNVVVPPISPLSLVSPLDADPSLPPYDPKKNYLSPRPQFLHYRPNPRIEHYLNREGELLDVRDGRQLEDSFSSESSEDDMTVLAEEKDSEEESYPVPVEEVEEMESPAETILAFEPKLNPEEVNSLTETLVSEPVLKSKLLDLEEVETPVKTCVFEPGFKSETLKRRPFRSPKMVAFLFVLIMALLHLPFSDSPLTSSSILEDQSLPEFYTPSVGIFEKLHLTNYLAVANENFYGLASRFRDWSTDSIAYFTSVTSPLKDDIWLHHPANMTSLAMDEPVGFDLICRHETKIITQASEDETEQVVEVNDVQQLPFTAHESEVEMKQVIKDVGVKEPFAVHQSVVSEVEKVIGARYTALDEDTEILEDSELKAEEIEMGMFKDAKEGDTVSQKIEIGVKEPSFAVLQSVVPVVEKEVDVDTEILDENVGIMVDRKLRAEVVEMGMLEDVKEDDTGSQKTEREDSESMKPAADTKAYELEKQLIEDDRSEELERERGHTSYDAMYVEKEVESTDMGYTQSPHDLVVGPEIVGGEEKTTVGYHVENTEMDHTESESPCDPVVESEATEGEKYSIDHMQPSISTDDQSEFGEEQQMSHGYGQIKSMNFATMIGLSLVLSATFAFLYKKPNRGHIAEKERRRAKKVGSASNSSQPCAVAKGSPLNHNGDEGVIGDSGSSEVSCSWNNTSSSGQPQTRMYKAEHKSGDERRLRRDSTASSSISYGSFTTYERLSAKKGGRDDEVVTPVRRSSRIRNLVISP